MNEQNKQLYEIFKKHLNSMSDEEIFYKMEEAGYVLENLEERNCQVISELADTFFAKCIKIKTTQQDSIYCIDNGILLCA